MANDLVKFMKSIHPMFIGLLGGMTIGFFSFFAGYTYHLSREGLVVGEGHLPVYVISFALFFIFTYVFANSWRSIKNAK